MRSLVQKFVSLRRTHPAWMLLVSPKGPIILAGLKALLDANPNGVDFEEAVERLALVFSDYINDSELELGDNLQLTARRELRQWLKRGLIVERNGTLLATASFQRAIDFIDSLDDQAMTSTASRLATVQRAIEVLESQLTQNQADRIRALKVKINALVAELKDVQAGKFEVLRGAKAIEGIREVYQLATSLHADFRRVEDSYREADRALRHRILSDNQNRGEIVDELLHSHQSLVQTTEGQVFESFHAQLVKTAELEEMKARLRSILDNNHADLALHRKQKADLQQLVSRLVQESERVIQARARSERDVRSFLKSGLADEQVRVGVLLHDILHTALDIDWESQKVRRSPSPLPPIAPSLGNMPIPERLLIKQVEQQEGEEISLVANEANPAEMDAEFWHAYHALNRMQLFSTTLEQLEKIGHPLSLGNLAKIIPPKHDLESLVYWLAMARQAGLVLDEEVELVDLEDESSDTTRFRVPHVELSFDAIKDLEVGGLE